MTEKIIWPACSITVSIPVKLWRFKMAFEVLLSLGASADGLSIPTAMVKAMPVFRYFDYGHSAEFVQGKKWGSIHALYNCGVSQRQIAC